MLTIKIVRPDGEQQVYETKWVAYHPENKLGSTETVEFLVPSDSSSCLITSGNVYVMNEGGKTIADYYLSQKA